MTGVLDLAIVGAVWLADRIAQKIADDRDKQRRHALAVAKANGGGQ